MTADILLDMRQITKAFPGVEALAVMRAGVLEPVVVLALARDQDRPGLPVLAAAAGRAARERLVSLQETGRPASRLTTPGAGGRAVRNGAKAGRDTACATPFAFPQCKNIFHKDP